MMEIYVVIKAGEEGIEGLLYADVDETKAVEQVKKLRQHIIHDKAKRESILSKFDKCESHEDDEWDHMLSRGDIEWDEYSNGKYENPDSICIQKWDGKEFNCVCPNLDVAPSTTWLM